MKLTELTSKETKEITKLLEKKESLQRELGKVEDQLKHCAGSGNSRPPRAEGLSATKTARKRTARAPRAQRGKLKEQILAELRAAGKDGVRVKEITKRLNAKPANIHAWFATTSKRMKELKKIGSGHYRLEE